MTGRTTRRRQSKQTPPSASRKTDYYVLGLLSTPTSGSLFVNGEDASSLPERKRAAIRRDTIGFVFQDFQLIPDLSVGQRRHRGTDHDVHSVTPALRKPGR